MGCAVLSCILSASVYAQALDSAEAVDGGEWLWAAPDTLKDVVVTATRSRWQLSLLPAAVTRIDGAEVRSLGAARLGEVLEEQTGISTVADYGGGTGIQLQGMDSEHVLVMVDGVPLVGRQAGTLDLRRLSVTGIEQVEVVYGATSSLYGNEALGGVVNIITQRQAPKGWHGLAMHRYGRFQAHDSQLSLSHGSKYWDVSAFANRYGSQGYTLPGVALPGATSGLEVQPFTNWTFQTQSTLRPSKYLHLRLSARHYRETQGLVLNENQGERDRKGEGHLREWNTRLQIDVPKHEGWEGGMDLYFTSYAANQYALAQGTIVGEPVSRFLQHFVQGQFQGAYALNQNMRLSAGIGWRYERLARTYFEETPVQHAPYVYTQYEGSFFDKQLHVVAGLRLDVHTQYASQLSPKLALRYAFNKKIGMAASFGSGFKAPDFRQLYFNFSSATEGYVVLGQQVLSDEIASSNLQPLPNVADRTSALKPEQALSYRLSLDYKPLKGFKIELSAFRNDLQNLINTYLVGRTPSGQQVFSYYNAQRAYIQGLALNGQTRLWGRTLRIAWGYQLLYAYDKEVQTLFRQGRAFARDPKTQESVRLPSNAYFGLMDRSRHTANVRLFYEWLKPQIHTNVRLTYRSRYGRLDTNQNGYLDTRDTFAPGYFTLDWAASKTFYGHYVLAAGVDNVLNFTDPLNLPQVPGILWYISFRLRF